MLAVCRIVVISSVLVLALIFVVVYTTGIFMKAIGNVILVLFGFVFYLDKYH